MLLTNLGAVERIIIRSIKRSCKDWICTEEEKAKILKCCNVVQRGGLTQNSNSDMYHACMVTWPITWLVTWYGDITTCKRFYWLHDGHVVCRQHFILDSICRAANILHSHFPALRKVGHNQNLSFLLTSLCQNKFWSKVFQVLILQRLRKFTSLQKE